MRNSIIISAELSTLSRSENEGRTKRLIELLDALPINYKPVQGMYKGSPEQSFIIDLSDGSVLVEEIIDIALDDYGQEAVLTIDENLNGTLIYTDGTSEVIGTFKPLDSYTRVDDQVYICEAPEPQLNTSYTTIRRM